MSYEKAIKHTKNHRKDRYYQQCGFSVSTPEKSYAAVAEECASAYYVGNLGSKKQISPTFSDPDNAVDFFHSLNSIVQMECGIFTDKGFLIMK